jgi:DNA-binding XRE family transcriptional regulator
MYPTWQPILTVRQERGSTHSPRIHLRACPYSGQALNARGKVTRPVRYGNSEPCFRLDIVISIFSVYNQYMGKGLNVDGDRLRSLRAENALTLRALAEISGVSYDTINKLELGRRPAHASTIRKLAHALGVEPRELMKGV